MYFNSEVEAEMRETGRVDWMFHENADREAFLEISETERVHRPYVHTPSTFCPEKGMSQQYSTFLFVFC